MKLIKDSIIRNEFIQQPRTTLSIQKLIEQLGRSETDFSDVSIVHSLIKYPKWHKETNIFQFIKHTWQKQLRKDPKCFFFFDASTEGFSTIHDVPFFDVLYYSCNQARIDPEKIIFFSSNMYDQDNIIRYNMENNITNSIKVVTFNNFESMIFGIAGAQGIGNNVTQHIENKNVDDFVATRLKEEKYEAEQRYKGKIFLSLSRVNRPHRTVSAFEIFNSDLIYHGMVSHNKFEKQTLKHWQSYQMPVGCNISKTEIKAWNKHALPLVVDTPDFVTNHAMSLSSYLHQQTLFQVVNETFAENWNGTSLFWSEKTFRSIYHLQPFIIFGQHQANQKLTDYGYKLYDGVFDYSFDNERDTYKRWTKLKKELARQVNVLSALPIKKQLHWKWRVADISAHNLKTMIEEEHTKSVMTNLIKYMKEKKDEKTNS